MILRRKRSSPEVQASFGAFHDVLEHLEPAKAALTEVMPSTRMPGRSLPDALVEFEHGLERAEARMPEGERRNSNRNGQRAIVGWPKLVNALGGSGRKRRRSGGSRV